VKKVIVSAGAILIAFAWFLGARQAGANIDDQAQIKLLEDRLEKAVNTGCRSLRHSSPETA
jgi:hypothetical protein